MKNILSYFLGLLLILLGSSLTMRPSFYTSVADLLTASRWLRISEFEDNDQDGIYQEFTKQCESDDGWQFNSDSTLYHDYGQLLCDPADTAWVGVDTMQWRLEDNDQILVLVFPLDEAKFRIQNISDNELDLLAFDPENPGIFKHKLVLNR